MSDDNDRKTITFYATTVPLSDNYTVSLTKDLGPTSFTDGIAEQDDEDAEQPHRYTKQRILGKGGNGVVIAAIDRKMQRPVALKISTTEEGRAEQLRFLREARVTGQLNHPNVMPVYDIGTDTDGHLFFTMKVVSGKSLSERLSEQSAGSLLQRLLVFRQVCNAIAFAHSRGVLHRDIKPANVMMGEFGEVLVVDWGICKVMDESVEDYQSLTSTVSSDGLQTRVGEIAGTPAYMAPEQARGEVESLDNRTDIYALGALLYTILTSKAPIEGPIEQVLERVIRGDIRSPREVAPDQVPRELDTIIRKAMHPDQESRYQTVSSLSDDVQAFIEKRPVSAVQYSALQRLGKWASRNQHILRPVGFTAALSLAALVSGGLVHFNQMAESRDSALIEAQRANDAEREARIEAINGRASLSTSEAMYGHPGAAIDQLRAIRQQMLNLNTDTLRADIGFAIAKRTAIQPTIITTGEDPVEIGMSNNGSHVALLNKKALQIFQNSDIERSVHSNLPTGSALTFGPWNNHAPWLIQASPDGVRAVHPITKEERNWTGTFDNCSEPRNTFDNGWIAQSCAGQGIVVWDWNHSTPPRTYPLSDAETHVIQISNDGKRLYVDRYVESDSQHHQMFSVLDSGTPIWAGERGTLNRISPNGEWIAASTTTGFSVIHIDSGKTQPQQAGVGAALLWTPKSDGFNLLDTTGTLVHYGLEGDKLRELGQERLAVFGDPMRSATIDDSQRYIMFPSESGASIFSLTNPDKPIANLSLDSDETSAVAADLSADSNLMVVSTEAGRIVLIDAVTGWILREMSSGPEPVRSVSFHPDGSRLLSAHWDGKARIWDLKTGTVLREYAAARPAGKDRPAKITEVLYLDEDRILITGADGHIGIWSTTTGSLLQDFSGTVPYVWDAAYSESTNRLLVSNRLGSESGHRGAILDLGTGEVVAMLEGGTEAYGVSVSPDGDRFVLTSHDSMATILNVDGQEEKTLPIATPPGYAAGWSPDGRILAVADFSGRYQLWTSDTWEMVANFGHQSMTSALLFSSTGRTLHVVTGAGAVYVMNLNGPDDAPSQAAAWLQDARKHIGNADPKTSLESISLAPQESTLGRIWASAMQDHLQQD